MITKKQNIMKNFALFAIAIVSSAMLFVNCRGDEDVYSKPEVSVSSDKALNFGKDAETKTIQIQTNRPWRVVREPGADWIDFTPNQGSEGTHTISVTVKSNPESARETFFTVVSSVEKSVINVTQAGADGSTIEYITIKDLREKYAAEGKDSWTIDKPFKLKAVVTSDRVGGNSASLRNGFMQDESGYGIAFRTSDANHTFNMATEVNIDLKGAIVSKYGDALQLGFATTKAKSQGETEMPAPKELTIQEIEKGNFDAILVKVKDVQFQDYKNLTYQEGQYATNRTLQDCESRTLLVRTTQYASFKEELLPAGKGNMIGILSWFKPATGSGMWQLYVRNLDDVQEMSNDEASRCEPTTPPVSGTHISIADLKKAISKDTPYAEDKFIEGEIILNAADKNIPDFVAYIADATGAATITFSDKENVVTRLPLGSKVRINIKDTKLTIYNGLWQIGSVNTSNTQIVEAKAKTPIAPKTVTIADILEGKYQSELVKVENVQFAETGVTYSGARNLMNKEGNNAAVYTNKAATFAAENVKEGSGPFIGVVSIFKEPQLLIRALNDLKDMTGSRFVAPNLSVDKKSISFEPAGGTEKVAVTSNVSWNVASDQAWLTVAPANGTNNGEIALTAAANAGKDSRSATVTVTDGKITVEIAVTQQGKGTPAETNLFISEYVEGSSSNKYIEIFNPNETEVDLSAYTLGMYNFTGDGATGNPAKEPELKLQLEGKIAPKSVIVFANSKATAYTGTVTTSSAIDRILNFNGNDDVALFKGETLIDVLGEWGVIWVDGANGYGKDKTLRRKASVKAANATFTPAEWDEQAKDDVSDLGKHTMN